jgi:cytochrome c oxidase subunit 3
MRKPRHYYHLVTPSPWPFLASFAALNLTLGALAYMHRESDGLFLLINGFITVFIIMINWFRDVVQEATYLGYHTLEVQKSHRIGFILFIFSEVMFFFGFFWAFFHCSLSPAIEIGSIWPPSGIIPPDPWGIPLLNTIVLLYSGLTITYTHQFLVLAKPHYTKEGFEFTLIAAVAFLAMQFQEYINAPFDISDGIYGSTFYMLTGFHGMHVLVGTLFIFVCYIRFLKRHFAHDHHIGFEAAVWYWHFVDVVWLFLFICVYWWGSL